MAGFRAYFGNLASAKEGEILSLSAEESRHLCGALRAKEGDPLKVFDTAGNVFEARLLAASPKNARVEVGQKSDIYPCRRKISIAQCLPKGGTFDAIISQSVQLGVSKIYPLVSERTIVRLDAADARKKRCKWIAQVVESMKQSANMRALEIPELSTLDAFLKAAPLNALKIVASLECAKSRPLLQVLKDSSAQNHEICVLIGPEGDLSPSEYAAANAAGFIPATLGENVMKCDVAAAYCASVVSAHIAAESPNI